VSQFVNVSQDGTVAVVALAAPNRNALNPSVVKEIADALFLAEHDSETTAVVLASDDDAYCSGADLNLLRAIASDPLDERGYDSLGSIYQLFESIQALNVPTLAAVNGPIVGAGINLALACDLRIVAQDVQITGFVRAGVHPGGGHLSLLAQRTLDGTGAAIALFGQSLDAEQAVRHGFATEAVPTDRLRSRAIEIARGAGTDKPLVEATVRSHRASRAAVLSPATAVQLERAPQVWSLKRRFRG
jgi:enoyl-CoA hydratase